MLKAATKDLPMAEMRAILWAEMTDSHWAETLDDSKVARSAASTAAMKECAKAAQWAVDSVETKATKLAG